MQGINKLSPSLAEGVLMSEQQAWIFCNGNLTDPNRLTQMVRSQDYRIAADGGAQYLRTVGLFPHLLVGDLDSLSSIEVEEYQKSGVEVLRFPVDKDETDLELALNIALERGFRRIRIAAALGGRIDQTLANIFHLLRTDLRDVDVRLDDGFEEVFIIRDAGRILGNPGDVVSLLPIMGAAEGVTTQGLRYALQGETLYPDRTRGISNRLLGTTALVSLTGGVLLCIHTRSE